MVRFPGASGNPHGVTEGGAEVGRMVVVVLIELGLGCEQVVASLAYTWWDGRRFAGHVVHHVFVLGVCCPVSVQCPLGCEQSGAAEAMWPGERLNSTGGC